MKKKRNGLSLIYLNNFLRGLGFSLVGIFIPIYFLTLGYSLNQVFLYFLVFHLITFIFVPITLFLSKRFGYKPLIIASTPFVILFLLLLTYLKILSIPIYLIGLISGIENAFYFIPLHSYFTRHTQNKKRGSQFSNYASLGMLSGLLGPLIGGLIATFFGFTKLFYLTIIFLLISVMPLFYLPNIKPITRLHHKSLLNLTKNHKRFFFATIFDNIKGETEGIVWPIFIFLTIKSLISVGYIGFLTTLGTILLALFIGRFHDKKNKYFFLKLGGLLYTIVWITRIYVELPLALYAISLASGFISLMIGIPYNAIFYNKVEEHEDADEFIIFTEIPNLIGRSFLWITMLLFTQKFTIAFILSALASLYFVFFRLEKKNHSLKSKRFPEKSPTPS